MSLRGNKRKEWKVINQIWNKIFCQKVDANQYSMYLENCGLLTYVRLGIYETWYSCDLSPLASRIPKWRVPFCSLKIDQGMHDNDQFKRSWEVVCRSVQGCDRPKGEQGTGVNGLAPLNQTVGSLFRTPQSSKACSWKMIWHLYAWPIVLVSNIWLG